MELKTLVCPNCGANTTNTQNCEYCGSLLVRFVERGIDLSHTSYLNNDAVFPSLIPELKRNLKLQEEHPDTPVATEINKLLDNGDTTTMSILSSHSQMMWDDHTIADFDTKKKGFRIVVGFDTYADTSALKDYNDEMDAQLSRFMQLDSFPLFTAHNGAFVDKAGMHRYGREYAIDFGQDVEGAARLISEILIKVNGFSPTETFDIFTNVGNDNIQKARDGWNSTHGHPEMVSGSDSGSGQDLFSNNTLLMWIFVILCIFFSFVGC